MNSALSARLEFEMLYGVGHVNFLARNSHLHHHLIEQRSCRPDEWLAGKIFLIAWLLADKNDARVGRTFAENGLRGVAIQIASVTAARRLAKLGQRDSRRQKIRRRAGALAECQRFCGSLGHVPNNSPTR